MFVTLKLFLQNKEQNLTQWHFTSGLSLSMIMCISIIIEMHSPEVDVQALVALWYWLKIELSENWSWKFGSVGACQGTVQDSQVFSELRGRTMYNFDLKNQVIRVPQIDHIKRAEENVEWISHPPGWGSVNPVIIQVASLLPDKSLLKLAFKIFTQCAQTPVTFSWVLSCL